MNYFKADEEACAIVCILARQAAFEIMANRLNHLSLCEAHQV
jgi:hypothetical protein